jgi:hypothetical protein
MILVHIFLCNHAMTDLSPEPGMIIMADNTIFLPVSV